MKWITFALIIAGFNYAEALTSYWLQVQDKLTYYDLPFQIYRFTTYANDFLFLWNCVSVLLLVVLVTWRWSK